MANDTGKRLEERGWGGGKGVVKIKEKSIEESSYWSRAINTVLH